VSVKIYRYFLSVFLSPFFFYHQQQFMSTLPPSMDDLEPTIGAGTAAITELTEERFLIGEFIQFLEVTVPVPLYYL
jgi:hypothetical protein